MPVAIKTTNNVQQSGHHRQLSNLRSNAGATYTFLSTLSPSTTVASNVTKNIEFNIQHINNKIVQMKLADRTQPAPNQPHSTAKAASSSKTRLKKKGSMTRVK